MNSSPYLIASFARVLVARSCASSLSGSSQICGAPPRTRPAREPWRFPLTPPQVTCLACRGLVADASAAIAMFVWRHTRMGGWQCLAIYLASAR